MTLGSPRQPVFISYLSLLVFFPLSLLLSSSRRMIANILHEIQQYQNFPYRLKAEPSIQDFLQSHDPKGDMGDNQYEDYLYDQSVEIEPRDQPFKKAVSYILSIYKLVMHVACVLIKINNTDLKVIAYVLLLICSATCTLTLCV